MPPSEEGGRRFHHIEISTRCSARAAGVSRACLAAGLHVPASFPQTKATLAGLRRGLLNQVAHPLPRIGESSDHASCAFLMLAGLLFTVCRRQEVLSLRSAVHAAGVVQPWQPALRHPWLSQVADDRVYRAALPDCSAASRGPTTPARALACPGIAKAFFDETCTFGLGTPRRRLEEPALCFPVPMIELR